jgi:hypothetical protein
VKIASVTSWVVSLLYFFLRLDWMMDTAWSSTVEPNQTTQASFNFSCFVVASVKVVVGSYT